MYIFNETFSSICIRDGLGMKYVGGLRVVWEQEEGKKDSGPVRKGWERAGEGDWTLEMGTAQTQAFKKWANFEILEVAISGNCKLPPTSNVLLSVGLQ